MAERLTELVAWLEHTLASADIVLEPASEDASFRRYFRIERDAGSLVVMDAPPDRENCRAFVHVAGLLRDAGLNAPEILGADLERGFLLLSDLGRESYLQVLSNDNATALYREAIDALVRMQVKVASHDLPSYDDALLAREMRLFPEWFLEVHLAIAPSEAIRETLEGAFEALCRSAAEQPQRFVHRDYHSRNLMYQPKTALGILDFQDAVHGPISYDLVSLLRDVYIRWPREQVVAWVAQYGKRAAKAGILDTDELARLPRWFDLMGIQRHLKIAGIFSRLYHRDKKPDYLKDIPLTLDYLLTASERYPELEALREMLVQLRVQERLLGRNAEILGAGTDVT